MIIEHPTPVELQHAAHMLKEGQVLAFPTETVYGLGADADNPSAVACIFETKGRPKDHPLIVHVGEAASVAHFALTIPPFAKVLMQKFWPGPLTLILPKRPGVADAASGGHATIGLRMPSHPLALSLLECSKRLGVFGVAAPSANRFGRVSPTRAAHVEEEFGKDLMVLDGGPCTIGIESTIIDCTRDAPILLRPGQLSVELIELALGEKVYAQLIDQEHPESAQNLPGPLTPLNALTPSEAPKASGRLLAHYAPSAKVELLEPQALLERLSTHAHQPNARIGVWSFEDGTQGNPTYLYKAMPTHADACAHELFSTLREFDHAGVQEIWIQHPPHLAQWLGVYDRLKRASSAQ